MAHSLSCGALLNWYNFFAHLKCGNTSYLNLQSRTNHQLSCSVSDAFLYAWKFETLFKMLRLRINFLVPLFHPTSTTPVILFWILSHIATIQRPNKWRCFGYLHRFVFLSKSCMDTEFPATVYRLHSGTLTQMLLTQSERWTLKSNQFGNDLTDLSPGVKERIVFFVSLFLSILLAVMYIMFSKCMVYFVLAERQNLHSSLKKCARLARIWPVIPVEQCTGTLGISHNLKQSALDIENGSHEVTFRCPVEIIWHFP